MLRAFIFDFDGVIVDSEPVHFLAFQRVLAEEGIGLTREGYDAVYLAMNDRDCFAEALRRAGRPADEPSLAELVARKATCYEAARDEVMPVPGVVEFVRRAAACGVAAVGSGGLRRDIEPVLARLGLREHFATVVSAEDYHLGKPDPECFRTVLTRLNEGRREPFCPDECLVVEDSFHGVAAARAAGMRCLAVGTYFDASQLAGADRFVATFEGLDPCALSRQLSVA